MRVRPGARSGRRERRPGGRVIHGQAAAIEERVVDAGQGHVEVVSDEEPAVVALDAAGDYPLPAGRRDGVELMDLSPLEPPPAWVTVKVWPAIVAVEVRCAASVFASQETVTDPDPVPLGGETVSHDPFPVAAQLPPVQPDGEPVTVTCCEPTEAVGLTEVGEIVKA